MSSIKWKLLFYKHHLFMYQLTIFTSMFIYESIVFSFVDIKLTYPNSFVVSKFKSSISASDNGKN